MIGLRVQSEFGKSWNPFDRLWTRSLVGLAAVVDKELREQLKKSFVIAAVVGPSQSVNTVVTL